MPVGDLTIEAGGLGAISLGTGVLGTGIDFNDCANGDTAACVGLGRALPGTVVGGAGLLPEGLLPAGLAGSLGSDVADYIGLGTGALGYGWDLANALFGSGESEGCE